MSATFAVPAPDDIPLHVIAQDDLASWLSDQRETVRNWCAASGFTGALGQALLIPDTQGNPSMALAGYGTAATRQRGRFHLAAAAAKLPEGTYCIASGLPSGDLPAEALGWLLQSYRFDRYAPCPPMAAKLAYDGPDAEQLSAIAKGEFLTRDLINTPANDMGPAELEAAARTLAEQHGAEISCITGADLLDQNFPMIHAVGRAAACDPRLIDLRWGKSGPRITLVGKGVCFDTGGLNLKPGASMGLMKKDMGGAAAVLGLAQMIMLAGLDLQLRVLIPAVENAVSGNAMRPQDILTSRKGLTVEINNTDAEGRLVLADALSYAEESAPDFIISMATLTGAARVAVGPDLAPYFSDDTGFAQAIEQAAAHTADPLWRLPLHAPYESLIEPGIADLDNAPKGSFAGAITAALFLRRFAPNSRYAHFDIYGWQPSDAPARPKGGVGQATRALFHALQSKVLP